MTSDRSSDVGGQHTAESRGTDHPGRWRGYLGTPIRKHRALRHVPIGPLFWLKLLLLPALASASQVALWPLVRQGWQEQFLFWANKTGMATQVVLRTSGVPWLGDIPSPFLQAALPSAVQWWSGLVLCAVLLLVAQRLPDALLPVRYLLRFVVVVQATAQVYFYRYAASYPYDSLTYLNDVVEQAAQLWFFLPWFLALIYLVLTQCAWRYLLLVGLCAVYLAVLTPLQYSLHAWLLMQGSLLWHPALYLLGTLLVQIVALIGLYSWAATWRAP